MSVKVEYIAASTNRHSCAADSARGSLVAFGSLTYVALWDAEDKNDRGVYATLPGHEGLVTAIKFVKEDVLISADDKGSLKCWKKDENTWRSTTTVHAHSKPISCLEVLGDVVVTGSSESLIKVWDVKDDVLEEVQSIPLRSKYPLSVDIATLPDSSALILAVGTTERNVQIWTRSEDAFVFAATLSGHEDWVKSLAFRSPFTDGDPLVLASGSQDGSIRLWNIDPLAKQNNSTPTQEGGELSDELLDAFEASLGELADAAEGGRQISLKRHILTVKASGTSPKQFSVTFDALLVGHEAGVTSLCWRPSTVNTSEPTLLSTSADSSLIMWSPSTILGSSKDGTTSLWINRQRFGDIGGQRLGGFVGGLWANNGIDALAWGWNGGWRRWRCQSTDGPEEWHELGAITGHSAPVRGLSWSPQGEYLASSSLDQTTRIHGPIPSENLDIGPVWHEIGRPQVHGYDLIGVSFLSATKFVSIADEKVARVFEAPREFIETVSKLRVAEVTVDNSRPRAAVAPPLGLSNKAVGESNLSGDLDTSYDPSRTSRRPFEGELAAITLWPEVEKVFGHGYESISLAVSNSGKLAATACKATSPEHAVLRVYDTENWQPVGEPLGGHTLTVTKIAFSPDDRYILSVSRDRTWRLFERQGVDEGGGYTPIAADKTHARIIWDCAWAHEGDVFATASRDKTVKIWGNKEPRASKRKAEASLKLRDAATAVAFAPADVDGRRQLAIGVESGEILIYSSPINDPEKWQEDIVVTSLEAHIGHIYSLAWRPGPSNGGKQLASCSEDGTLKILRVHMGTV